MLLLILIYVLISILEDFQKEKGNLPNSFEGGKLPSN